MGHGEGETTFERIYGEYRSPLLKYVRKVGGQETDGEDVVQETFARALKNMAALSRRRDPWPWLTVVARNILVDGVRERGRVSASFLEMDPEELTSPGMLPLELLLLREELAEVRRSVGQLPPVQQHVLGLLANGATVSEAAYETGLSQAAVRQHACRLRRRLRQAGTVARAPASRKARTELAP